MQSVPALFLLQLSLLPAELAGGSCFSSPLARPGSQQILLWVPLILLGLELL